MKKILLVFFPLFLCADGTESGLSREALSVLQDMKSKLSELEEKLERLIERGEHTPLSAEDAIFSEGKHWHTWTKEQEMARLKDIEKALVENPLGSTQKKMLKKFVLQVKDDSVKAEALFFLGEVYYLRQKLMGGKK